MVLRKKKTRKVKKKGKVGRTPKKIKPPPVVISERVDSRTITTMRLPSVLLSRLTGQAAKEGRSRSNLIERVLGEYIEGLGDEQSIFG